MPANILRQSRLIVRLSVFAVLLMIIILMCSAIIRLTQDNCISLTTPDAIVVAARFIHRISASLVGIVLVIILFLTVRLKPVPVNRIALLIILIALTLFLAMLGKFSSGTIMPAITIANIIAGMAMMTFFWLLRMDFNLAVQAPFHLSPRIIRSTRILAPLALFFLLIQICLGSWIAGLNAGIGCNHLPATTSVIYWPDSLILKAIDPFRIINVSENLMLSNAIAWLGFIHRLGSLIVVIATIVLAVNLRQYGTSLRRTTTVLLFFLVIQALLGIAMVEWKTTGWIGVVHNAIAAFLLLQIINIYYWFSRNKADSVKNWK
ncbi:MAG TPA: COX15/CtaA family protein [Burkholderiaceae bacterium]|nr:COX15/CtaA family protein [Burkholderiaceae bacterium]